MKKRIGLARPLAKLVEEFSYLPGVGSKTAERFAFYILRSARERAENLSQAIMNAKEKLTYCRICSNLSEDEICQVCQDDSRNKSLICVVEEPDDVFLIEKTGIYRGLYHVLLGSIYPLEGIGPDDLRIKELIFRVKNNNDIKEIILATSSNTEGEITALYLEKVLNPYEIKLSRIASGMPVGSELDYADEVTLGRAIENRIGL